MMLNEISKAINPDFAVGSVKPTPVSQTASVCSARKSFVLFVLVETSTAKSGLKYNRGWA